MKELSAAPQAGWRGVVALLVFFVAAALLVYIHLVLHPMVFREGLIAPYTVITPIEISYIDSEKLAELSGQSAEGQEFVVIDPAVTEKSSARLEAFRTELLALQKELGRLNPESSQASAKVQNLAGGYKLDASYVINLLNYKPEDIRDVFAAAERRLRQRMSEAVAPALIRELQTAGANRELESPEGWYVFFLLPNLRSTASPQTEFEQFARVTLPAGSVLVPSGGIISRSVKDRLAQVSPHILEQDYQRFGAIGLLLLGCILVWYQYLRRFADRRLLRTGVIMQLGMLFIGFLAAGILLGRMQLDYAYYSVAFAVAALASIVVLVYDTRFAIYLSMGLAAVLTVALKMGPELTLYTLSGAALPTLILSPGCRKRAQVTFALLSGCFYAMLAATVTLSAAQPQHWQILVIAFASGFGASVTALGLLPMIESFSSQCTPGKLIDLANQENALLKRLKREAPGTYAHSMMVADLAEEACKEIGAASMLTRVGALYHDIGKLKRPGFFAENIHDLTQNPHLGLPSEASARIIKEHVPDGLQLARENSLPKDLYRFIAEHHGSYQIKYFFVQAQRRHEADPENNPEPEAANFRYEGPIPQSRETAVLMLADVTEAVTRARGDFDEMELKWLLDEIVEEKLQEGQLLDSALTVGDLEKVKSAFHRILIAQRHHRLRYPQEPPAPMHFHMVGAQKRISEIRSQSPMD
ncbi:HDIG domain-containing protein [bacterium]|nr:HDIG domain-containing protein [bacterium]